MAVVDPPSSLASVDLYITGRCNRRCTYCFLPREFLDAGQAMTPDRYRSILDWATRNRIDEVTLLGGEPSLHPNFDDFVGQASDRNLQVRVVTNGAPSFQRLLRNGSIRPRQLSRVAVSFDTLDHELQDRLRGRNAHSHATTTIELLNRLGVPFDINVTAVASVLPRLFELIDYAETAGCRRVNVHWPSAMGIGRMLQAADMPTRDEWTALTTRVQQREFAVPGFFVEIEKGFLAPGEDLVGCSLETMTNLQILPDGTAFACGLLVDDTNMSSMTFEAGHLRLTRPGLGEDALRVTPARRCDGCPLFQGGERRACILDKLHS